MDIYLDNAATSHPKPDCVISAVQHALTVLNTNPGRSGHRQALAGARLLLNAREAIAGLINAPDDDCIIFCFNCTDALNMAIKGILHIGDHVIASSLEHNSVLRVLEGMRLHRYITVTLVDPEPDGAVCPDRIVKAIRPDTALCILTHASNVTGALQPVAAVGALMRAHGIHYLIDGAQAAGHLPVDVQALKCDLYAFPGHKGLLGPQGTGILYAAPGLSLRPFREGGTGSSSDSMTQPSERPECFESGTVNLPGIAGLFEGAKMIAANQSHYLARERELTGLLWEGLRSIPGVALYTPQDAAGRVGVVSFNLGSQLSSAEAADRLDTMNIAVRGGIHCAPAAHQWLGTLKRGALRASLSWQNTPEEIDVFLRAVRSLV